LLKNLSFLTAEEEVGIHLANLPQIFLIGLPPLVLPPCG